MNLQEFDKLVLSSQPHPVLKLDWSNYKSLEFANTFLPSVQGYKATALYMFDGGGLFTNIKKVDRGVLPLSNHDKLITTIGYSYPKGVLASQKVNDVEPAKHELLVFMEVESDDRVHVKFKSGDNFKQFLSEQPNARSIDALYATDIDAVQNHFNRELVQKSMLQFVLNALQIEFSVAQQELLFSLDDLLSGVLLFDRYKPTVFIRKNQKEVFNETKEIKPTDSEIYIWLISEDYINYDTHFIFLQIGKKVGEDFNERKITEKYLAQFILDVIKAELDLNPFDKDLISAKTSRFLNRASFQAAISDDFEKNPKDKELFEKSPNAYFAVKALTYYAEEIEKYTLLPNRWLSKDANYNPILSDDIIENAFVCGLINGMIQSFKGIPEGLAFFWEITVDIEKQSEFIKSIKKLLEEENLIELLIKGAIAGYSDAKHPEEIAYQFGKDVIVVIEIVLGIITFFEGGGISSFINGTKNVLRYLKRFGKGAIEDMKGLARKQLLEIFEKGINPKRFKTGTGGFLKYKRIISRNVLRQEELNSCAAACIRQLAKDKEINLTEKRIRKLARTSDEGTFADGIEDAMIKIFGEGNIETGTLIDPDFNDVRAVKYLSENESPWIAWLSPSPLDNRFHAVIVEKVIDNDVFIKDPWPIKGIDESSVRYFDNGDLDHTSTRWLETNGVEVIADLNEFATQWAFGQNKFFKLKN
jgi:hypothetical protein